MYGEFSGEVRLARFLSNEKDGSDPDLNGELGELYISASWFLYVSENRCKRFVKIHVE
jgi:hypothetical protein